MEAEPASARVAALGGAALGLSGGEGWELDPSALAGTPAWSLRANEALLPAGLQRQAIEAAMGQGMNGGWGLRLSHTSFGSLDQRDESGALTGSFEPRRLGLGVGYGWAAGYGLSLGSAVSGFQESLGDSDVTGVMLGLSGRWAWSKDQALSLALQSVTGSTLERVALGGSGPLVGPLGYALEALGEQGASVWSMALGLEGRVGPGALRLGWRQGMGDGGDGLSGFSAGLGLAWQSWALDYAWLPLGGLGSTQRLSVAWHPWSPSLAVSAPGLSPGASSSPGQASGRVVVSGGGSARSEAPALVPPELPPLPDPSTLLGPEGQRPEDLGRAIATQGLSGSPQPLPSPTPALQLEFRLPDSEVEQAYVAEQGGELAKAKAAYEEALKADPKDTRAWMGLGQLYYRQGDKGYAIQCFEQVLRLNPTETKLQDWLDKVKAKQQKKP